MIKRIHLLLDAIKFEHSIFALPFAYLGMVLAAGGLPTWGQILWMTMAMVGARTLAMAANRIADAHYDAANPRTAGRAIPRASSPAWTWPALGLVGLAALLLGAWMLNPLCFQLTPIAVAVLVGYLE